MALRWMKVARPSVRRRPTRAAALAALLIALAAPGCAARRQLASGAATGVSSAARYRLTWQSEGRSGSLRVNAYAAGGDRLRLDVYPPVGGLRLSVVCAAGKGVALVPPERAFWQGPCDPAPGEAGLGLPRGARFWTDVLLGRGGDAAASRPDDPEATVRVEPAGAGEPPARIEAGLQRDGRSAQLTLVRQTLLDPAGDAAFDLAVPEGFLPAEGFDLMALLVPREPDRAP